jgi:hypothetical protein
MKMVGHQTISLHPPERFLARALQGAEKQFVIRFPVENGFAPVTPTHHVIECSGILDSEFARHAGQIVNAAPHCQTLYANTID